MSGQEDWTGAVNFLESATSGFLLKFFRPQTFETATDAKQSTPAFLLFNQEVSWVVITEEEGCQSLSHCFSGHGCSGRFGVQEGANV